MRVWLPLSLLLLLGCGRQDIEVVSEAVEVPGGVQGTSLVPHIKGKRVELPLYAQTQIKAVKTVQAESFPQGGWKLLQHTLPKEDVELFELNSDPTESAGDRARNPGRAGELLHSLQAFRASLPVAPLAQVQLTSEEIGALKDLGYIG